MDAKTAVLTYFAPALGEQALGHMQTHYQIRVRTGVVLANLMFISPVAGVREARLAGALKELNPVPYPFIIANCINWVVYGTLIKYAALPQLLHSFTGLLHHIHTHRNLWVFWSNGPGILLGVYLTISALPLASPKQRYQVEIMVLVLMGTGACMCTSGCD
jgi:solute carrier family 50 protein (sugar transporter)